MNNTSLRLFVSAIVLVLLTGCQEGENTRWISKEKGVYSGKADETLSDETRQQLRRRMIIQRGGSI